MRKLAVGLALLVIATFAACRYLLPERFAVNAPIGQMLLGRNAGAPAPETIQTRFRVPKGYSMGIYAEDLPNARLMRFTSTGELLVSQPRRGQVVVLERDRDSDGRSDGQRVLLGDLNRPTGLALQDGWLYVGETNAVGRIRFDAASAQIRGDFERIITGLPGGGNHWGKTLAFGPDGWLYVTVGSSCNVCLEKDSRRAAMLRFQLDGGEGEIFATGLRNTVGFDWRPTTGELYGTDNGRDLLGDNFPPCELNRIEQGRDYGWPYANGNRVPDPDQGTGAAAAERIASSVAPAHAFRAHNAPLGMRFIRRADVHPELEGAALVALHGSWNRTRKDGYKVVSLHWQDDGQIAERDFMVGFLRDESVVGRPVDIAEGPDGAIYVSDDYGGVIWRVAREAASQEQATLRPAGRYQGDPLSALAPASRRELAAKGEVLFRAHECASCHDARPDGPSALAAPLGDLSSRYDIESLVAFLRTPTPPMPVAPIDDRQRRSLAVYLFERSTGTR